jgi:hypothetical protein
MITPSRLRAFLLTLALGLAAVHFAEFVRALYIVATIPIPQNRSGTIIVRPQSDHFILWYGGGHSGHGDRERGGGYAGGCEMGDPRCDRTYKFDASGRAPTSEGLVVSLNENLPSHHRICHNPPRQKHDP